MIVNLLTASYKRGKVLDEEIVRKVKEILSH